MIISEAIFSKFGLIILGLVYCGFVNAGPRIAILDFALIDITSLPDTLEERVRTASIKPLLEQAISEVGDFNIIQISLEQQGKVSSGVGYLFRFHDVAAKLGKQVGADWVIVGQHSKPSFLYSYLMVNVVNVKTKQPVARYAIELKGNHAKVTHRGVMKLAGKISRMISNKD